MKANSEWGKQGCVCAHSGSLWKRPRLRIENQYGRGGIKDGCLSFPFDSKTVDIIDYGLIDRVDQASWLFRH